MLEYFSIKKLKKHREEKEAKEDANAEAQRQSEDIARSKSHKGKGKEKLDKFHHGRESHDDDLSGSDLDHADSVLNDEDEAFLADLMTRSEGPAPPLPPRIERHDSDWHTDSEATSISEPKKSMDGAKGTGKAADKAEKKPNRLSMFLTRHKKNEDALKPEADVPPGEAEYEKKDLGRVLDRLNLTAKNNKVLSISNESSAMLGKFTQVFKDLVNGVPTAYDDLAELIEDRDGTIERGFDKLPSSLKKLVTQLPEKLTSSLAPEVLAAAAESQGIKSTAEGGMKSAAKKMFLPQNIMELVTKPGAIVGMLRAIVETLKARWPAFLGMNVIWSVALSLLMFVLWYCYKRGREVRIEREKSEAGLQGDVEAGDRIEELPDDPTLPAPRDERISPSEVEEAVLASDIPRAAEREPVHARARP